MGECPSATTCQRTAPVAPAPRVMEAAERLACLLTGVDEFQNFLRSARAARLDPQVGELISQINGYASGFPTGEAVDDESAGALEQRLEALPVMSDYRQAEMAVRGVFALIDAAVGEAAGLPFAENAKPKACG